MSIEIPMAKREGVSSDVTVSSVVQSAAGRVRTSSEAEADGREARLKASLRGFPDGSARGRFFFARRFGGLPAERLAGKRTAEAGRNRKYGAKCSESVYTSKFLSYTIAMRTK